MKGSSPCVSCHFSSFSISGDNCLINVSIPAIAYHDEVTVQQNGSMIVEYCFPDLPPGNHTVLVKISDVGGDEEPYKLSKVVEVQGMVCCCLLIRVIYP